jgi:hypothetical protein
MMRGMPSRRALCLLIVLVLSTLAGCGSGSEDKTSTEPTAPAAPQKPAAIPKSWDRKVNTVLGFSIGVPPHWRHAGQGSAVLFRSPDRLVAVSVSAERRAGAFEMPPGEFARRAIVALPGYRQPLRPGPTRPLGGTPFDTAAVRATGVAKSNGVRQKAEFDVLRRDHSVNFTAVVAANAKDTPHHELDVARQMVRSVRDHPPQAAQRSGRSG